MDIYRAQKQAEDMAVNNDNKPIYFTLKGPTGEIRCEWIDPFMGLFRKVGEEGFMTIKDIGEWPIEIIDMEQAEAD